MKTAIIGNGGAAAESIIALRSGGYNSEIHLFSDSKHPAFNPTLITYFIAGKIDAQALPFQQSDFYKKHDVKLHMGSRVTALDAFEKTVENSAGERMVYDNCVVCSGASPIIPDEYQGCKVFTVRCIDDASALKDQLSPGKKALIAGASMIGIKVAEALAGQGIEVSLTDTQPHVFPLTAHRNCAERIEQKLAENGIRLCLGSGAADLSEYDFIVICAGVTPNIGFLDKTQVNTDKGVLVDINMRTNRSGLYAAGDAAQVRDAGGEPVAPGLWASARYMGRTAGSNIAGKNSVCAAVIRHNHTRFFGYDFASAGDISNNDDVFETDSGEKYCRIAFQDGRVIGINLFNMPEISGMLKSRISKATVISDIALGKVFCRYPEIRDAFMKRGA